MHSIATASGDARIDRIDGDVKFQAASGSLAVGTLHGHVSAPGRIGFCHRRQPRSAGP